MQYFWFPPVLEPINNMPVRTCATDYNHQNGETEILEFGQTLWFGEDMEYSLLSLNQVQEFHHNVSLNPKQYQYTYGKSEHGIHCDTN